MNLLTFCAAAIVVLTGCNAQDDKCPSRPIDITMILDTSVSIDNQELKTLFSSVAEVAAGFDIGKGPDQVRVAAVGFGYEAEEYFDYNAYTDVDSLVFAFENLDRVEFYKGTRTDKALDEMMKINDDPTAGNRQDVEDVCIVFTDGRSTNEIKLEESVGKLPKDMKRYSVGIGDGIDPNELELIAENDPEHVFYAATFDDLQNLIKKIISEVKCRCDPVCVHGECDPETGECICDPGYQGDDCSTPCTRFGDVVMVVDCSKSLNSQEYSEVLEYAASVVQELDVGKEKTRVGVVKFGKDVDVEVNLNENNDKDFLTNALRTMERPVEYKRTNTSHALWKALDMFEKQGRDQNLFDRKIVLVTDGRATDRVYLRAAVADLVEGKVVRFVVGAGIGDGEGNPDLYEAAINELKLIAGREANLILSPSTADLHEFTEELIKAINECLDEMG